MELLRGGQDRPTAGPDTDFERNEEVARVRAALARLPTSGDREALLLKAEGFGYDEIASTLGLAKGAVGTTLARARRRLGRSVPRAGSREAVSHLDEGTLHALLDGELDLHEVKEIQASHREPRRAVPASVK